MLELNVTKKVKVKAKTIEVLVKARDTGSYALTDQDGDAIEVEDEGYVPSFFPGQGGDYIDFKIDLKTGNITNWPELTAQQVEEWVEAVRECK